MKASHKKTTVMVGYQNIDLNPGQFIFGRHKAASTLNLSEMVIRRCLESLKIAERITIKATNKFSIITIINWELYQSDEADSNQQNNQQGTTQATNNEPTNNQQRTTYNNVKECKKNVKERFLPDSIEVRLSKFLFNHIQKNNPNAKEPNYQSWAKHIDLAMRVDGRSVDDLKSIIGWCQRDTFWAPNILSTEKLRKQFDQLWVKMKSPQKINNNEHCSPCPPIINQESRYADEN